MNLRKSSFLVLWSMAVTASVAAFCVLLTLRVRAIEMGYELGRVHGQLGRLREVRRVLELEVASYQTPERVDLVARTLLGMAPPGNDRMLRGRALPKVLDAERQAVRGVDDERGSGPGAGTP
jgi:cell division protein FtsL